MGIVFRQSVKTTIVIGAGAILGALVVFLSSRLLPKQELGFTRNLTTQAVLVSQLFLFGLHNTLSVYIHQYSNTDRRKQVLITLCLLTPLLIIGIATIIYFIFKYHIIHWFQPQDIPFMQRYFMWLPLFALFFIYQALLEAYLASQMKVALGSFIREIVLRIVNISLIILFGLGYISFDLFVAGTVLVYLVPVSLMFFFSKQLDGFGFSLDTSVFTIAERKELIHFSWYHALLSVSITLIGILDTLMLAPLDKKGLSNVAIYSNAVFFLTVLQIPYKAMVSATFPEFAKTFKSTDRDKTQDIFQRSSINIFIASVGIAVIIFVNLHNAVDVLKRGYEEMIPIVYILSIGVLMDIATGMNGQVLSVSNYYKSNFYLSAILVTLMVVFNVILIPRYGIYGAAWSTSIALTIYNIGKFSYVRKKLGLQPFSKNTILIVVAGGITWLCGHYLPYVCNSYIDVIVRTAVVFAVYLSMLLLFRPSKDLQTYIQSIKTNKKLF